MMQTRPKLMGMVIIASVLWCAPARPVSAFMQQAADKPTYTIPEYNAFQAARGETNPQNRIKLLDDFVSKFHMHRSSLLCTSTVYDPLH